MTSHFIAGIIDSDDESSPASSTHNSIVDAHNLPEGLRELVVSTDAKQLEKLTCAVCFDVYNNPCFVIDEIGCKDHVYQYNNACRGCRPCMHSFCLTCIKQSAAWLKCPTCKHAWSDIKTCTHSQFESELSQLTVKCPYTECKWTGQLGYSREGLQLHLDVCDHGGYVCDDCGNHVARKFRGEHMLICPDAIIECECGREGRRCEIVEHRVTDCTLRTVCCKECNTKMMARDCENHNKNECPGVQVQCVNNPCTVSLMRRGMQAHHGECKYVPVSCKKCNLKVPKKLMDTHTAQSCPKMMVDCEYKCAARFLREESAAHMSVCELAVVCCDFQSFGCTWTGIRREWSVHLNTNAGTHLPYLIRAINTGPIVAPVKGQNTTTSLITECDGAQDPLHTDIKIGIDKFGEVLMPNGTAVAVVYIATDRTQVRVRRVCGDTSIRTVPRDSIVVPGTYISRDIWSVLTAQYSQLGVLPTETVPEADKFYIRHCVLGISIDKWNIDRAELVQYELVDCCDSQNKWYLCRIEDVRRTDGKVFIRYFGWNQLWNEWIDVVSCRLAPPWCHSDGSLGNRYADKTMPSELSRHVVEVRGERWEEKWRVMHPSHWTK